MNWTYFKTALIGGLLFHLFGTNGLAPEGTAPLKGKMFLDKSEVSNLYWLEYVHFIQKEEGSSSDAYKAALPDKKIWKSAYSTDFNEPGIYAHYPVVGVNFPQVLEFCKWRSDKISAKRKRNVVYTLPSFEQFYLASKQNSDSPAADLYSSNFDHRRNFIGVCDNAAEMTNIEGLAVNGFRGDGCLDSLRYLNNGDRLGFRCIAYFKKK